MTGCIAAYKSCEIARALQKAGVRVKVCMTEHATSFVGPTTFRALTREEVAVDLFDNHRTPFTTSRWPRSPMWCSRRPATANVVAKVAHGQADDLLTTTVLATDAPVVVAPAMNVGMWQAEATQKNIATLEQRGFRHRAPRHGLPRVRRHGGGQARRRRRHRRAHARRPETSQALAGERVLITAGDARGDRPRSLHRQPLVGQDGHALARAARAMGGRGHARDRLDPAPIPFGVEGVRVESAAQMLDAVSQRFDACTMLICAAAVADYAPAHPAPHKLSKADGELTHIDLVKTADILAEMSRVKGKTRGHRLRRRDQRPGEACARAKLERKGCDAIVANDVSRVESTFGSDTNAVTWVSSQGVEELPCTGKQALAFELLRRAVALKILGSFKILLASGAGFG